MIHFIKTPEAFQLFAALGILTAVVGVLVSALVYRGKQGERYSPLNHFISELGEVGVSRLAWVFNLSLIITGLWLGVGSLSLGLMLNTLLSKITMVIGVVSALSLSLVGVFPMNRIKPHSFVAIAYFRSGLAVVILFSLAIALQPASNVTLSRWFSLAGVPAMLSTSVFIILMGKASRETDAPLATEDVPRPRVWLFALVEWSIFATMILWFGLIAVGL